MPLTLGLNLGALTAQSALRKIDSELSSVFERLSSGQRINRASDDPAGLALADGLRSDSRIFAQAYRNVNDGISLFSIADASLEELESIVTRIEELAIQASNGSLNVSQRRALNTEAQELSKEYSRISRSTEFNDFDLFDGSLQSVSFQAGIGTNGQISSELGGVLGTGTFGSIATYETENGTSSLELADFDGDGNLDVVTADFDNGNISVQFGDGSGNFADRVSYSVAGAGFMKARIGDVNNDGVIDVVVAENYHDTLQLFLGNSNGTFQAGATFSEGPSYFDVKLADFDGDGNLDVVGMDASGYSVVSLGNGDGTFEGIVTYTFSGANGRALTIADLNGDGNEDFIATSYSDSQLSIRLGNGDGTFGAESIVDVGAGTSTRDTAAGDFNGDGIVDLASINRGDEEVVILTGAGDGTFQLSATLSSGNFQVDVNVADLDGDGNQDIITANEHEDQISIFFGNGNGSFEAQSVYSGGENTYDIAIGDLNNDGVYDIVTASNSGAVGRLLQNTKNGVAPLLEFDLSTQANALQAVSPLSDKREQISIHRGVVGAALSRLESATRTIASIRDNSISAEARIRDADVAADVAALTRLQVLQQAATAVLAQANLTPQRTLELISGSLG